MSTNPSSERKSDASQTPRLPKLELNWCLTAIVITTAVATLAWLQPPYPYPVKPLAKRSLLDQVIYPIESNGELRLWQPITTLNSVATSSDQKFILAVGNRGAAVLSTDGGRNWHNKITGLNDNLTYAWISDDGVQGGAVTFAGLKYEMSPDDSAWKLVYEQAARKNPVIDPYHNIDAQNTILNVKRQTFQYFNDRSLEWPYGVPPGNEIVRRPAKSSDSSPKILHLVGSGNRTVWAIGDYGSIVTSDDGGANWELRASTLIGSLSTITFLSDGQHGWAAGYNGVLLRTIDGGDHWLPTDINIQSTMTSVMFLDNGNGWMVAEDGALLSSQNFGRSWTLMNSKPKLAGLRAVYFRPDGLHGWIAGDDGAFLSTADGGSTWTNVSLEKPVNIQSIRFSADRLSGVAIAKEGMVVTYDGGENWKFQPTPDGKIMVAETAAYSIDTGDSWIAREDGEMLSTSNGRTTLQRSYSPARSTRLAMWFSDTKHGWAVGLHPALTRTQDGGKTWTIAPSPVQYSRYPAPWFWFSLLPITWMWMRAFRTKKPPSEDGVAAIAASDAPTQYFSQDRLGFGPLAKGISRFLRNEATEPPLTLAISGDWGTGKSSLMTLICRDLLSNGCRPVWFNAWHHQKDEQLLAALLNAVREQSLPSLLQFEGWIFRWRLLALRTKKHWIVASLIILAAVWLGAYVSAHEASQWQSLWTLIDKTSTAIQQGITPDFFESLHLGPLAAKLVGLVTAFVAVRKALTAFGTDPAVLLSNSVDQFRLKEASELTSFRSRFAKEFEEVTQCLPGRLVIVIDDLDRCRAEAVLEVMEAVNFLVSSGKCFVIFGMATNRVQAALALSFEKIAQEMTELDITGQTPISSEAKGELERTRRRKYARDYLEKLINLEIEVPANPSDEPHRLLEEGSAESRRPTGDAVKWLKVLIMAACCAGAVSFIWHLGESFQLPTTTSQLNEVAKQASASTTNIVGPNSVRSYLTESSLDSGVSNNPYPLIEEMDTRNDIAYTVVAVTLLVVAAGTAYALLRLRRNLYKVQDSPAFKKALAAWLPLVQRHRKTPRALKRFANRLRYLAMLQQAQRLDQSGWDLLPNRLKKWLGMSTLPQQPSTADLSIDEHRIVALGALYEVYGSDWKNCATTTLPDNDLVDVAKKSIKDYCAIDARVIWPPTPAEIDKFATSLTGIRIPS
jgi:photosystem II stability/assembly factor-like uncharacterized protein/Cdc6-like AAA superfamily ATPase